MCACALVRGGVCRVVEAPRRSFRPEARGARPGSAPRRPSANPGAGHPRPTRTRPPSGRSGGKSCRRSLPFPPILNFICSFLACRPYAPEGRLMVYIGTHARTHARTHAYAHRHARARLHTHKQTNAFLCFTEHWAYHSYLASTPFPLPQKKKIRLGRPMVPCKTCPSTFSIRKVDWKTKRGRFYSRPGCANRLLKKGHELALHRT